MVKIVGRFSSAIRSKAKPSQNLGSAVRAWFVQLNAVDLVDWEKITIHFQKKRLKSYCFWDSLQWWIGGSQCIHTGVYRREPQGSKASVQLMWKPSLPLPACKKYKGKVKSIMCHIFLSLGRGSIHNHLSRSYHLYLISHQQMGYESLICQHVGNFFFPLELSFQVWHFLQVFMGRFSF